MRVALTGVGLVTALGLDAPSTLDALFAGTSGIGPCGLFNTQGFRSNQAGVVHGLSVPPGLSRTDAMALTAASEALKSAAIDPKTTRVGLVVGGTTGGMFETEEHLARMFQTQDRSPHLDMISHPLSATVDRLRERLGPFVRTRTICSACSSGANAFVLGSVWIRLGLCDVVLVGGTDGLCRLTFAGFGALSAMTTDVARPFDVSRNGLTLGEGAGFAVLERLEHAKKRGAPWDVEFAGFGVFSEAHHLTHPDPTGIVASKTIVEAIHEAGLVESDISYVNAHGTGTVLNDVMEAQAIERAFRNVEPPWVSSIKGQLGHTLGAAGAIEAIVTAEIIRSGRLPTTIGLQEVDPRCRSLRHVMASGQQANIRAALSNSFGFGGVDTVLAFTARDLFADDHIVHLKGGLKVFVHGTGSISPAGVRVDQEHVDLTCGSRPSMDEAVSTMDPQRARRLDRSARLASLAVEACQANVRKQDEPGEMGVALGSAYGDADGSAAFVFRLFDRGARLCPPADFPNLVPSSATGQASIFLGLHGPALSVADLTTSGEAGIVMAHELVAAGVTAAMAGGSVEVRGEIAALCLGPLFGVTQGDRKEGAAALLLRTAPSAISLQVHQGPNLSKLLECETVVQLAPQNPQDCTGIVVMSHRTDEIDRALDGSTFSAWPRTVVPTQLGTHEGLGAFAALSAVAQLQHQSHRRESGEVSRGEVRELDHAMVIGLGREAYVLLFSREK